MDDVVDETVRTGTELDRGDTIVLVTLEIRTPFDVETDYGGGESDVMEPGSDVGGVVGEESVDGSGEEGDVVEIVSFVREFVIEDCYSHAC